MERRTEGFWADMEYESDQTTQEFETSERSGDDIQGVMKEVEEYKKTLEEKTEESQDSSEPAERKSKEGTSKTQQEDRRGRKQERKEEEGEKHSQECSCEICFYKEIREMKEKNDKNLSLLIDDYMGKPPMKNLQSHPKDCLCGTHMKMMIKGKKIPYTRIIQTIRNNKYSPPK